MNSEKTPLKIDIIVGGRFHADRMALALLQAGHDVRLITPFPKNRFPELPPEKITSLIWPEIFYRALRPWGLEEFSDQKKMVWFGKQASHHLRKDADGVIAWSSFALESFQNTKATKILIRDSAHIEFQMDILREEYSRYGVKFVEKAVAVSREKEEYQLCDHLVLLSEFAKKTFIDKGFDAQKIAKLSLGADLSLFQPDSHPFQKPLKVLYFGTLSLQKGVQYLLKAFERMPRAVATLDLVGSISPEFKKCLKNSPVELHPAMKHDALSQFIRTFDVFVFPTLHDGFGQTLLQAMASGVIPVVTENCGASEIIEKGKNGAVIPIRSAETIYDTLRSLAQDKSLLENLKSGVRTGISGYSWENYGESVCELVERLVGGVKLKSLARR